MTERFRDSAARSAGAEFATRKADEPPFGVYVDFEYAAETGIKTGTHGLGYVPSFAMVGPVSNGTVRYMVGDAQTTAQNGDDPKQTVLISASGTHVGRVRVWVF